MDETWKSLATAAAELHVRIMRETRVWERVSPERYVEELGFPLPADLEPMDPPPADLGEFLQRVTILFALLETLDTDPTP